MRELLATISAVINPMIVNTMTTSIRVKPLSRALRSERKVIEAQHGYKEGCNYAGDEQPHDNRHSGHEKGNQALNGRAHLLIMNVGSAKGHIRELPCFLTDLKQMDGLRGKETV